MSRTRKDTKAYKIKLSNRLGYYWTMIGGVPSSFKKMKKKIRRAKEREAVRRGGEQNEHI